MILIINCGSSSIKFDVFTFDLKIRLICSITNINEKKSFFHSSYNKNKVTETLLECNYGKALETIMYKLNDYDISSSIAIVGHRVVHGGEIFKESCLINDDVMSKIDKLKLLAPVHNPINLSGIKYFLKKFPNIPHIATFDTAFHQTLPQERYLYAIPYEMYAKHKIRKYGMHGISYSYVVKKSIKLLDIDIDKSALIIAHLGNGASACAVKNGISIDTTMGMTPAAGLMMGTRSGDVDPGLFNFLNIENNMSIAEITDMINNKSGLLGISGLTNNCRALEEAMKSGNNMAKLSLDMYCYIAAKQIAALAVNFKKINALIFCGGVGENSIYVRQNIVEQLQILKLKINKSANKCVVGGKNGVISTTSSSTKIIVTPTDEAMMIATDALQFIEK